MSERPRRPARYYADEFVFTPAGVRVSELTDDELLVYDPSRAPRPDPAPGEPRDEPDS